MITEDRKFLDLDHVCDEIISQDDRAMFSEAIRCYQIGSHRAAIILAWCVTADCLYRRIDELATEGDGGASQALNDLKQHLGTAKYEEQLISQAKKCDLFDDYEEKCLRFARDTRSKCAHPTGVIPSAEAVRNILHICSQTVLCREGYRGISFVTQFVKIKLDDRHIFSERNRIHEACRYYFGKVPERIRPQFAHIASGHVVGSTTHWKTNALTFFAQLLAESSEEVAKKIGKKFQPIESTDRLFFSILVGLDKREGLWDEHVRNQAKSHLRDALRSGKVEESEFNAYANICALTGIEANDKELLQTRFSLFAEKLAKHTYIQEYRAEELITLVLESITDDEVRDQTLKGIPALVGTTIFNASENKTDKFIDALIQEDWHEDAVSLIFQQGSDWSIALKVAFLKKAKEFLLECSDDYPDFIFVVFEIANAILLSAPNIIPSGFEYSLKEVVEGALKPSWFDSRGEIFHNFIRQLNLLRTQHSAHLPILSALTLPGLDSDEQEVDE